MFVIINCLLLMAGTMSAIFGISFYYRNKETSGNMRVYILFYGLCSALWCISYGFIGIIDDFAICDLLRKPATFAIETLLITETFLGTEMIGMKKTPAFILRTAIIILNVVDYIVFTVDGFDIYYRQGAWTTWHANPASLPNRRFHAVYMAIMFLVLFSMWCVWFKRTKLKRIRFFLYVLFFANVSLILFCIPDLFMPIFGMPAISTSGFGGAACTLVIWYGATKLNSFDIRMGNVMQQLFDFIEVGIVAFSPEHRSVMSNRYSCQAMDRLNNEGCRLEDIFDISEAEVDGMFEVSLDRISADRLWDKSGTNAYSVRMSAMKDDYGEVFCYLCVFLDVTDEVEVSKKLEMASNAKSRFLAQMSHEIRTPINAVLGMNEMILRESDDSDILEYSKNIDSAGNTLLVLINSILDFSKIEDGKMDIIPANYELASLIDDLYVTVVQRAESKGLVLSLDISPTLPRVMYGDDVRISQIIMNLLTNAVKYTEKGTVTLTIREERVQGDSIMLYVSVRDTGIGIKEEDIGKLSVSFERIEESRNRNIEGTGLGISIVTSLLDLMGSKLRVDSTYGEGSDFYFTLEQKIIDRTPIGDIDKAFNEKAESRSTEDLICAPAAKVLVVDDNEMNLKVAGNLLKLCRIKPDFADSGYDAIDIMEEKDFDVVFLDHMMPKMDGIETLRHLKHRGLIPEHTTMIALTADAVIGAREKYLEAGFDDYLSKPIDLNRLVGKLREYLPSKAYDTDDAIARAEESGACEVMEFAPQEDVIEFAPQDEVLEFDPVGDIDDNPPLKYDLKKLAKCGIDTDAGIRYCADDADMYGEMLGDFVAACDKKCKAIEAAYETTEWHDYAILVHALKSNARTLGMNDLADMALSMENAAKDEDSTLIIQNHNILMEMYHRKKSEIIEAGN